MKLPTYRIDARCRTCGEVEAFISGWQGTIWADGVMPAPPIGRE